MSRLPLPARLTHDAELLYVVLPASSGDRLSSEGAALSSLSQRLRLRDSTLEIAFVPRSGDGGGYITERLVLAYI